MWTPDTKQWWVVWLGAATLLALWWSTAKDAASGREETDPVMVRLHKEYKDHNLEQLDAINADDANGFKVAGDFASMTQSEMRDRRRAIVWSEYQPRIAATVVCVAAFTVWWIQRRRDGG